MLLLLSIICQPFADYNAAISLDFLGSVLKTETETETERERERERERKCACVA